MGGRHLPALELDDAERAELKALRCRKRGCHGCKLSSHLQQEKPPCGKLWLVAGTPKLQ